MLPCKWHSGNEEQEEKTVKTNFFFGDGWIGSFGKVYGDFFFTISLG